MSAAANPVVYAQALGPRNWVAQPGSQVAFLSCPVREILYEGTRGPGKTDCALVKFAKYTGRGFGSYWRGLMLRETYKQLDDAIIKSKRLFGRYFPQAEYNKGNFTWSFPGGEELLLRHFAGIDDYANYHGHEYPYICWDELTNWRTLDAYDAMKSTNRSSFPGIPRFYIALCNPFGKGHSAVKGRFIDVGKRGQIVTDDFSPEGRVTIHGNLLENRALVEADPSYYQILKAITDPNRRKAWAFGSWDIEVGTMFDDLWNTDVHVLAPFEIPRDWTISRSMDWGSSKPFSIGWWATSDGTPAKLANGGQRTFAPGTTIRVGEWYGWNGQANVGLKYTTAKVAEGIQLREARMFPKRHVSPGPADNQIFDADPERGGNSQADEFKDYGILWLQSDKSPGSRKRGWQYLRGLLENAAALDEDGRFADEDPGLFCFDTCAHFRRIFPSLPRDEVDPDDVDTDSEDHLGDEARYHAYRKPFEATQHDQYSQE